MTDFDMRATLRDTGVVPVVVMDSDEAAVPLANCLVSVGVKMIEVTLRRPAAWKVMERLVAEVPEIIVGAGSVTSTSQLERLAKMGVRFAVSPGLTANLIRAARNLNLPYLPGAVTPSEILTGMEEGLTTLKFFPAELSGGVSMLNALRGPLPDVMFCPTGGIDVDNAAIYASCPNVIAVGSSWVVPEGAIMAGQWQEIAERVERFRAIMRQEIAV